jgi:hypothetical protein
VAKLRIETILLAAAFAIQTVFAFWGPIVQKAPVPPGDDPAFHMQYAENLFQEGSSYPPLFHALMAGLQKVSNLDMPTLFTWVTPLLLLAAPLTLWFVARKLFGALAAALGASAYILSSPALARGYGDGNYPDILSSLIIFPLAAMVLWGYLEKPTRRGWFFTALALAALPLAHHLSLAWQIPALALLTLWKGWEAYRKERLRDFGRALSWLALPGVVAALVVWHLTLRGIGLPFGQLAGLEFSPELTLVGFQEILGTALVFGGVAALPIVFLKRPRLGWLILLWALPIFFLARTGAIGFTERFARELAMPLSIALGASLDYVMLRISYPALRGAGLAVLSIALLLISFQIPLGVGNSFTLPQGFRLLTRVKSADLSEWSMVERKVPIDEKIIVSNANPYLSIFLNRPLQVIVSPGQLLDTSARYFYLPVKPENTPPEVYPFYRSYDEITERLGSLPSLILIQEFPSGARLYSVTTNSQ